MPLSSAHARGPGQRDGTFSDVLANPDHPQHPRTEFEYPDEDLAKEDLGKLVRAHERMVRFVWGNGKLPPYPVLVNLAAYTWLFFPSMTGAKSQTELLRFLGMKDKQQFNRALSECRKVFQYFNPLMRDEAAVRSFQRAASLRTSTKKTRKGG